jgi:hypothetical protein
LLAELKCAGHAVSVCKVDPNSGYKLASSSVQFSNLEGFGALTNKQNNKKHASGKTQDIGYRFDSFENVSPLAGKPKTSAVAPETACLSRSIES